MTDEPQEALEFEPEVEMIDLETGALQKHEIPLLIEVPSGESTQKENTDDDPWSVLGTKVIDPPIDLDQLALLTQTSAVRPPILEAIARNTVGLGYSIQAGKFHEHDTQEEEMHAAEHTLEKLAARDTRLDRPSFTELMYAVKHDEEEVGQGYIEVSRSRLTGLIDGLFYAPSRRIRRLRDRTGYCMIDKHGSTDEDRVTYFYNFGEKVEYDEAGQPLPKAQPGKRWNRNELIVFRLFTSETRDYGLPRDSSLALEYAGDKLAAESNLSFFDSSGTPPSIIFVHGQESQEGGRMVFKVPKGLPNKIADLLRSDGGHRHRVAIIPLPPGATTDHIQLGQISDRDVGFGQFRRDIKGRVLSAFRVSPIFIADVDDSGRYTAEVQRAITLEQVFDPDQQRYQQRLRWTVLNDLGVPNLSIVFKKLAVESDAVRRDSADKMAEAGVITRKELRAAHGFPPLPEANEGAKPDHDEVEWGWNDELVDLGQPRGAEDRVVEGTDQRGLKPGIGGRVEKHGPEHVEHQVETIEQVFREWFEAELERGLKRTHSIGKVLADAIETNGNGSHTTTVKLEKGAIQIPPSPPAEVSVNPTINVEPGEAPVVHIDAPPPAEVKMDVTIADSDKEVVRDSEGRIVGTRRKT